jgi:hypothetical protein
MVSILSRRVLSRAPKISSLGSTWTIALSRKVSPCEMLSEGGKMELKKSFHRSCPESPR